MCVYVFKPENSLDQLGTEMLTAGWDQTDVTDGARLPLLDVIEDLLGVLEHLVNVRVAGTDQPVFFAVPVLHTVSRAVTGTIFTLLRQPSLLGFVRVSRHLRISERLLRLAESLQGPVFDSSTNASVRGMLVACGVWVWAAATLVLTFRCATCCLCGLVWFWFWCVSVCLSVGLLLRPHRPHMLSSISAPRWRLC